MTPAQLEARAERKAIMLAESATPAEIEAVFRAYPEHYGISEIQTKQGELLG